MISEVDTEQFDCSIWKVSAVRMGVLDSDFGQDLVDAVVGAIDSRRTDEVDRLQAVLETVGLAEAFKDEMRLAGVPSVCNGECWSPYLSGVA